MTSIRSYFNIQNKSRVHSFSSSGGPNLHRNMIICYPGTADEPYFTQGVKSRVIDDKPHFRLENGKYIFFVDQWNYLNICSQDPDIVDEVLLTLFGDMIEERLNRVASGMPSEGELRLLGATRCEPYNDSLAAHRVLRNRLFDQMCSGINSNRTLLINRIHSITNGIRCAKELRDALGDTLEHLLTIKDNIQLLGYGSNLSYILDLDSMESKLVRAEDELSRTDQTVVRDDVMKGFEPENGKVWVTDTDYLIYNGGPLTIHYEGSSYPITDNIKIVHNRNGLHAMINSDEIARFSEVRKLYFHPHIYPHNLGSYDIRSGRLANICFGDSIIKWRQHYEGMLKNDKNEYSVFCLFDYIKSMLGGFNPQSPYFRLGSLIPMVI